MKICYYLCSFAFFVLFIGCENRLEGDSEYTIFSDLEETIVIEDEVNFSSNYTNFQFGDGIYASKDFARSGIQSIKLDENQKYGLRALLPDVKQGQFVRISVWQKEGAAGGSLVASMEGEGYNNTNGTHYDSKAVSESGWTMHCLTFTVAKGVQEVLIYLFSGQTVAYFDDIKIEVLEEAPKNKLTKKLDLIVPFESESKLNDYISDALKAEVIASKNKKYVPAYTVIGIDTVDVKMKLKGDGTDHIKSGKTSYRIKIKGNEGFEGLKSFSIQHPKIRNYLHEWVLHEIAKGEDLLSTEYEFINVSFNGVNYGVYALEEHFDKQLLEHRKRREGPIVKYNESGAWAYNYHREAYENPVLLPYFSASFVDVFKSNRTMKNSRLKKNFETAKSLLYRFKNGTINLEEAFDIDVLAKFYAVNELSSHYHALTWHNRRFYFNPITQKLEPILFDVVPHAVRNDFANNIELRLLSNSSLPEAVFDNSIILNKTFKERYLFHLNKMTRKNYLDSTFEALSSDLSLYSEAIKGEDKSFKFDKTEYYRNAEFLRSRISVLDSLWKLALLKTPATHNWALKLTYSPAIDSFFVEDVSLNTYVNEVDSGKYILEMNNYHVNSVSVIAYERDDIKNAFVYFEKPVELPAFRRDAVSYFKTIHHKPKKILFQPDNLNGKIVEKKVIPWSKPAATTTREYLAQQFKRQKRHLKIKNNTITIAGKVTISKLIYVPKDFNVEIAPNSTIEFKNGGGLIINNSLTATGTKELPIHIFCKDSSSNGLTILNAKNGVTFEHVNITGLSNLNYGNWELTGAVNIYDSPTSFSHVTISSSTSEDALNIIRSHFLIDSLVIENTASDGFDADFCTGKLSNSQFFNTGNDCIDFSGSEVDIFHVIIAKSGDKGISGGEKSVLTLKNISINGAITGIASKDGSTIKGKNITVKNAEYGFAAFRKKGEYPPAGVTLTNAKYINVAQLLLIGKDSFINLNGKMRKGTDKVDVEKLYERFTEH